MIEVPRVMVTPVDGFEHYTFPSGNDVQGDRRRTVYWRGPEGGPGVILLHELPGMVPQCVQLATQLSDPASGGTPFQVHMPLLFGEPDARASPLEQVRTAWCIRREFSLLSTNQASPIAGWVRDLTGEVSGRSRGERVGVIGMCLTGGLVLGLVAESNVGAVVASQPSLPLPLTRSRRRSVGVPFEQLQQQAGQPSAPVLAARYRGDWWCPRARLERIVEAYDDSVPLPAPQPGEVQRGTFGSLEVLDVPGKGHALLTLDPSQVALTTVREFLTRHLTPGG